MRQEIGDSQVASVHVHLLCNVFIRALLKARLGVKPLLNMNSIPPCSRTGASQIKSDACHSLQLRVLEGPPVKLSYGLDSTKSPGPTSLPTAT